MLVIRCTRKLLARLKSPGSEPTQSSTTSLGDWYGNTLSAGATRLALFVSEPTFLPVVIPLRESRTLIHRFRSSLADVLRALAVPEPLIRYESDEGGDTVLTVTASRRVLGVMNDLSYQAKWIIQQGGAADCLTLSLALGEVPCGPLKYVHPIEAARQRLANGQRTERTS